MQKFRRWLLKAMRECDRLYGHSDPHEAVWLRAAAIVDECGNRAARAGLAGVCERSLQVGAYLEPEEAQVFLSQVLGELPGDKRFLTVPEAAWLLKEKPEDIRHYIRTGELHALNMTKTPGGRPKYRISLEAWDSFLARRAVQPRPKRVRRRRSSSEETFV